MNRRGKSIICFHCGENHPILECNDTPITEREQITADKNAKWVECKAVHEENKQHQTQKKQVAGQVHMQVSIEEIEG